MHGFNRPLGPIGSNVVAPLQATSSGMMVTANKMIPGQEAIDFKGYFKVESFATTRSSTVRATSRPRVPAQERAACA